MENPFSYKSRTMRRGVKNYRNCQLRSTRVEYVNNSSSSMRVAAILSDCPTIQDQGKAEIGVRNTNAIMGDAQLASSDALAKLERFCGGSLCADCVYVGMNSPLQVAVYRRDQAAEQLAAQQAQAEAEQISAQILHPERAFEQ